MRSVLLVLALLLVPYKLSGGLIEMANIERASELFLLAATVAMEAEGESYRGKLAVAFVIMNRVILRNQSLTDVIFDPYDFSAWNTRDGRQSALDNIGFGIWWEAEKAAAAAYYRIEPDLTLGADHYLNVELTKKIRKDKRLPRWVSKMKQTVKIGKHTFYKEVR